MKILSGAPSRTCSGEPGWLPGAATAYVYDFRASFVVLNRPGMMSVDHHILTASEQQALALGSSSKGAGMAANAGVPARDNSTVLCLFTEISPLL